MPYSFKDISSSTIPITLSKVSYGFPVIASIVSPGISKALRQIDSACVPFAIEGLTRASSVLKTYENISSTFSLPMSLYP